ncbi:MAG: hypothetical protein AAF724_13085 [Pseudomonadota bacterium]
MDSSLDEEAIRILKSNDRGGFTVPTPRLYPYQWNWDSAFVALGFAVFDRDRAWREIETLFEAQWSDGMLPHIIFRQNDPDYFPGPAIWQSNTEPPSSGVSQPPITASIALRLVENGDAADLERARILFPKLVDYHRWFHLMRDPQGTGLVGIVHPWESGRDNCPDWDVGMNRIVVPDDLGPYTRRDTGHVNPEERPSSAQYDRYLTIVRFGRECGWDHVELARNGPFFMADPGVQFILMRADRDLLRLAELLGNTSFDREITSWLEKSQAGSQRLWNPKINAHCARDLRTGVFSDGFTSASMLALYAGTGAPQHRAAIIGHARRVLDSVNYGFPSFDPTHPRYEPKRYWRGPAWTIINYLIAEGLGEAGEKDLAKRIADDSRRLVQKGGFYEYFDPHTGEGLGGPDFSWTAAIHLAWGNMSYSSQAA